MHSNDARDVLLTIFEKATNGSDCEFSYDTAGSDSAVNWYYDYDDESDLNFVFRGVGILILVLFGVSVNVLSVIVLCHPNLKSPFSILLLGLTISDLVMLVTHFLFVSLHIVLNRVKVFPFYFSHIHPHLFPYLFPIGTTAKLSSIYFTVVITLERYIAVCHPLKVRLLCTRSAAIKAFFLVVTLTTLFTLPKWFKLKAVPVTDCYRNEVLWYDIIDTKAPGGSEEFIHYYYFWGYSIAYFVIPFICLVYFNSVIYVVVKQQRALRSSITSMRQCVGKEDAQLAAMLMGIVITFLVCYVLNPITTVLTSFDVFVPSYVHSFENFLEILSHSTNFIYYCAFGTRFRRQLRKTLGLKERQNSSKSNSSKSERSTCTDDSEGDRRRYSLEGNGAVVNKSFLNDDISNSNAIQVTVQ